MPGWSSELIEDTVPSYIGPDTAAGWKSHSEILEFKLRTDRLKFVSHQLKHLERKDELNKVNHILKEELGNNHRIFDVRESYINSLEEKLRMVQYQRDNPREFGDTVRFENDVLQKNIGNMAEELEMAKKKLADLGPNPVSHVEYMACLDESNATQEKMSWYMKKAYDERTMLNAWYAEKVANVRKQFTDWFTDKYMTEQKQTIADWCVGQSTIDQRELTGIMDNVDNVVGTKGVVAK
jgi:hypothetical protein